MGFGVFQNPSHQVHLSVLQPSLMLDAALSDDRLTDSANVLYAAHGGDFQCHLERDFLIRMDVWGDINIYPHIDILKLSIHQRTANASSPSERTGRDGDAVADLQRGFLI